MMMMTKENDDVVDEQSNNNNSNSNSNSSIFEGLSFPQVPVMPIVISRTEQYSQAPQQQQQQQQSQSQQQQQSHHQQQSQQQSQQSQQQSESQQQQQQPLQQLNFSSLYITESDISSHENRIPYPDLSTISTSSSKVIINRTATITSSDITNTNNVIQAYNQYNSNNEYQMNRNNNNENTSSVNSIMNTMRSFVVGEPHNTTTGYEQVSTNDDDRVIGSVEMQTRDYVGSSAPPILARIVSNPIAGNVITNTTGNHSVGTVQNNVQQQPDNTLISNLIGENARLARENQQLKQRLEASGLSTAPDVGDWVMERMNQSPPQPSNDSVKYVCCGRCRQWLRAPKEAVYVYCQTCDAVNNCSTTIAREQQQQNQHNNIIRRLLQPLENCFPGISNMTI